MHVFILYWKKTGKSPARDGKGEQKQEENAAVNSNVHLKESSFTALLSSLQILEKVLMKHEHRQQWFCSMGFKEASYNGYGLEAMPRSLFSSGESLPWGELIRLIPVLNTSLQEAEIDRCMCAFTLEWIVNKWKTVNHQKIHSTSYFECGFKKSCFWWGLGYISFPCCWWNHSSSAFSGKFNSVLSFVLAGIGLFCQN